MFNVFFLISQVNFIAWFIFIEYILDLKHFAHRSGSMAHSHFSLKIAWKQKLSSSSWGKQVDGYDHLLRQHEELS